MSKSKCQIKFKTQMPNALCKDRRGRMYSTRGTSTLVPYA